MSHTGVDVTVWLCVCVCESTRFDLNVPVSAFEDEMFGYLWAPSAFYSLNRRAV